MLKIEDLYYLLAEKGNFFSSNEEQEKFDKFYKKHIESKLKEKGLDFVNETYDELCSIISIEQKIAFKNGFKTAISLILDIQN